MDENQQNRTADVPQRQLPRTFTFFGSYDHSVDTKGRLIVPTAYRKPLGDTFTISVTPDGEGIALYPEAVFDDLLMDLYQLNRLDESLQKYLAYLGKMSYRNMETDTQGRILIPARLRQRILKDARELEVSGAMDYVRIVDAQKGNDEDDYFDLHRADIHKRIAEMKAEQMARKGEAR